MTLGDGPAPESLSAERDAQGLTHYDRVAEYYRTHKVTDYEVGEFFDQKRNILTDLFYKGDRSMRESGFDPSNRFGPFSVDMIHYDPVCLNSLLYLMESQTAEILAILGNGAAADTWRKRAADRAAAINRLMWDARDGLYYDYNFAHKTRAPLPVPHYVLSPVGGHRDQGAGGRRGAECGQIREARRPGRPAPSRAAINGTCRSAGRRWR
jgi:neutral trehalase